MDTRYLDILHVGPPEEKVQELYRPLLPYLEGCRLVLDVGCGRGTVLQMLAERGISAIGCDSEPAMVAECRRRGLDCTQTDALEFLRQTARPLDGICCGHLIEHLPTSVAMELIALCYERLEPGGTLVIVTPNPADLKVITHYFWMDLTHVRPYPGVLLEEMLQHVGFSIHASHDAIMDSLQSKTGVKKLVGSIVKWIAHRSVGIDVILRGDTVVVGRKLRGQSRRLDGAVAPTAR